MHRSALAAVIIAAGLSIDAAQLPKLAFEVASVRPQSRPITPAEAIGWARARPGGRLIATHTTLHSLITYAYDLKAFQVIGGPDWIRSDWFSVDAKAASDVPLAQLRRMLQSLLEDRFGLATHTEQRDMRYLALVPARKDGQPGPRLRRLDAGACDGKTVVEVLRESFPPSPDSRNRIAGACVDLRDLAQQISLVLETLVIDKTGMAGQWVFEAPYGGQPPRNFSPTLGAPVEPKASSDPGLPPYTVALEEQLGLKLESARGPVDVLIIDSARQPSEN